MPGSKAERRIASVENFQRRTILGLPGSRVGTHHPASPRARNCEESGYWAWSVSEYLPPEWPLLCRRLGRKGRQCGKASRNVSRGSRAPLFY
jgi:hypothetical protein